MARFYANENFPLPAVEELRRLGHDVLTTLDAGKSGQAIPDNEVLEFAIVEGRTLLTFNRRDFIQLHKYRPNHAGIVVCSFDPNFIKLAERIHSAVSSSITLTGELIRVNRPNE